MNRVKDLRIMSGMSQKELALTIGAAQPTVSEWERQRKDPTGERLRKLCELFNCTVNEVVIPDYRDPYSGIPAYISVPQSSDAVYFQERLRRNPDMQELFDAADNSTPDKIQAATEMLKNPSGTPPDTPRTPEARILSAGIDKMPPEDRERALNLVRQIFVQYAAYFERKEDDDR